MAQIGDIVRYLNSVGGGRITRIEGNLAYVDEDGFETPVLLRECVVVEPAGRQQRKTATAPVVAPAPQTPSKAAPAPNAPEIVETAEGEVLNVVLAYEPQEIKHLTTTTFDTYLVNDSNYYLYFTYLTRSDEAQGWTTRYAGMVEPNIQLFLGELTRDQLPLIDRVAVQYVAYKVDKEFKLKAPVAIEARMDNTKFFKLHCFRENVYFEKPVIAIDIVKDDIPQRAMVLDSSRIEESMKQRRQKEADLPKRKPVTKHTHRPEIIEVDLHIDQLVDSTKGLSAADMLNLQVDEFRRVMDANLKNKGQKIVFIHGKGEGVLRKALLKELAYRYKTHQVQDASFREYGYGATQVTIR
ncbi:MAG: DUF2027 domain-containing protein [Bacteroidales bacterium]|nr:DUF2027 domain-containing protein [Bacteroidales bacterium]